MFGWMTWTAPYRKEPEDTGSTSLCARCWNTGTRKELQVRGSLPFLPQCNTCDAPGLSVIIWSSVPNLSLANLLRCHRRVLLASIQCCLCCTAAFAIPDLGAVAIGPPAFSYALPWYTASQVLSIELSGESVFGAQWNRFHR